MSRLTTVALVLGAAAAWIAAGAFAADGPGEAAGDAELARVDGAPVTRNDLATYVRLFYLTDEAMDQLEQLPQLHRDQLLEETNGRALPELVNRRLLLQAAREKFAASDRLDAVLDRMVREKQEELMRKKGSMVAVLQSLHRRKATLSQWKAAMRETILVQSYLWETIGPRVRVSPEEMRRYYDSHMETLRRPRRVVYRVILVDAAGCASRQEERRRAEQVLERLRQGESFAELAEQYSVDRDRTEGGLREVVSPAVPPDWLPPLCRGLEPGQTSGALEQESGFCIVRLERIVPAGVPPFDEVQGELSPAILERLIADDGDTRFLLVPPGESASGEAIYLWQRDVREVQLATGAIRAGISILLRRAGLEPEDLGGVLLAGAFGNFIRRSNAMRIGLLPPIAGARIRYVGNAASLGAKLALLSGDEREYAETLRRKTQHVDLSMDPAFQEEFGAAMLFPEESQ